ncbi:MAG: SEC-C domain-containing protein [bacterium]
MTTVSRNAPCPCGSGKKYKKCCMEKDQANRRIPQPRTEIGAKPDEVENPEAQEFDNLAGDLADRDTACVAEMDPEAAPQTNPSRYPKPREELPVLPADQQALVKAWWEACIPLFKGLDTDGMIRLVVGFMEEHPNLFVHLGLEHEVLFELGAELGRRKEWSRYAALLIRIREEHPEMYVRSFSYYDYDLIVEALVSGQLEAIPRYFNFFHQYPDSDPDNAHRVTDLLAWTGMQDELFAFAKPLAIPMWISPEVIEGEFILRWLVFAQYVPLLDALGDPDESARALMAAIEQLDIPDGPEFDVEILRREFRFLRETPDLSDFSARGKDREVGQFHHDVRWNYCAFLHDAKGFPWVRADFLANRLEDYWSDRPAGKKPKDAFMLSEERLNEHIARTCRDFFNINGVRAVSLVEAVWHFVDYLAAHSRIESEKAENLRAMCRRLFDLCLRVVDSTDPALRLMPEFPEMACLKRCR